MRAYTLYFAGIPPSRSATLLLPFPRVINSRHFISVRLDQDDTLSFGAFVGMMFRKYLVVFRHTLEIVSPLSLYDHANF